MLGLTLTPMAAPMPPVDSSSTTAPANGEAGGFADLLDGQRAAAPIAGEDANKEAASQTQAQEPQSDHDEPAVGGIWLAQDWMQRLSEPSPADEAGSRTPSADAAAARTTGAHEHLERDEAGVRRGVSGASSRADSPAWQDRTKHAVTTGGSDARSTDTEFHANAATAAGAEDVATDAAPATRSGDASMTSVAALALGGPAGARATGTLPAVHLATPAHDAQFPAALAAQVSVLVQDGVQEARLHLHPAEMGPVAVRIAMEGSRAHVQFTAAVDSTCQLLQDSLGQLDSALNEAGLSLAGSSVSQQSADPGHESPAHHASTDGRATPAQAQAAAPTASHGRPLRPRGIVDLVA